jgi:tetratricopeptide (TPR) repeat protein
LSSKEGMASNYGNLGLVYQTRGNLDKAIEFQQKALKLNEDLGRKKGMAINYGNLGNIYKLQGNNAKAKRYYLMSIELFKQLGNPIAKTMQTRLDALQ